MDAMSYLESECLFVVFRSLECVRVLEGMDVVSKIEAVGSQSGTPSKKVVIVDSGELDASKAEL
jgi:hypothetical protein